MEGKAESEEMTYPHISFAIDNYEDMFDDVVVRDGESLGIELTAWDNAERINVVLFSASVPYETMKRVYDARASQGGTLSSAIEIVLQYKRTILCWCGVDWLVPHAPTMAKDYANS